MPIESFVVAGRYVMGSLTTKNDKDTQQRPIPPEKQRFFFGVAVPKQTPGVTEQIGALINMAYQDSATLPNAAGIQAAIARVAQNLSDPGYSLKVEDGDAPNARTGQVNENTAGCFVFKFGSSFPFNCCKFEGGANVMIAPADIKRGWYVEVAASSKVNGNTDHTAGIYLNPSWIRLIGYGPEIVGGPTADQAFAAPPPSVPGMSAMPVAGTPMPGSAPSFGAVPMPPTPPAGNPAFAQGAPVGMPAAPAAGFPGVGTAYGSPTPGFPQAGAPAAMPPAAFGASAPPATAFPSNVAAPHPGILAGPPTFGAR